MIKFRAWDEVSKVMRVPTSVQLENGEITQVNVENDELEISGGTNTLLLEQFTGLKDVNGRDIYVGDVVRTLSINVISDIKYMRDGITPEFEIDRQKVFDDENVLGVAAYESDIEVIGNVHENSELLKG